MKTFSVYILFFAFALRPIYNIGYVAYFQLNVDYIIETYCVNKEKPKLQCKGKCHLAKQLTFNSSEDTEPTSLYESFSQAFFPVFFKTYHLEALPNLIALFAENNWQYLSHFYRFYKNLLDPPPQLR